MESSGDGRWGWLHKSLNVLHAPDCALTNVRVVNFICGFFFFYHKFLICKIFFF